MVKISILYPNNTGDRFDLSYYVEIHMPMSIAKLSSHPGYKGVSIERGLSGAAQGSQPAYVAMCHYLFDSVDDFMAAFMPIAGMLQGDIPNYTDIEPVIQVSEVLSAASAAGDTGRYGGDRDKDLSEGSGLDASKRLPMPLGRAGSITDLETIPE